jgi:hypothetical protein
MARLNRRNVFALGLAAGVLSASEMSAHGAVIALYSFASGSAASTDSDSGSTAGNFTIGAGLTNAGLSTTSNNAFARSDTTAASEAAAADTPSAGTGTSYFGFTVTPGTTLSLTSLTFKSAYNAATAGGAAATASYFVRSSRDNFTTDISSTFNETYQDVTGANGTFTTRTVDLSAASFQNLSSAVEFRIYIYDNSTNVNQTPRLDDVTLNGVPEPSSVGLAALGGLGLLARRRRRKA